MDTWLADAQLDSCSSILQFSPNKLESFQKYDARKMFVTGNFFLLAELIRLRQKTNAEIVLKSYNRNILLFIELTKKWNYGALCCAPKWCTKFPSAVPALPHGLTAKQASLPTSGRLHNDAMVRRSRVCARARVRVVLELMTHSASMSSSLLVREVKGVERETERERELGGGEGRFLVAMQALMSVLTALYRTQWRLEAAESAWIPYWAG